MRGSQSSSFKQKQELSGLHCERETNPHVFLFCFTDVDIIVKANPVSFGATRRQISEASHKFAQLRKRNRR